MAATAAAAIAAASIAGAGAPLTFSPRVLSSAGALAALLGVLCLRAAPARLLQLPAAWLGDAGLARRAAGGQGWQWSRRGAQAALLCGLAAGRRAPNTTSAPWDSSWT